MKIVVTGASGFVGKNLTPYLLDRNKIVKSLSLRSHGWEKNFDETADVIIHLAGKAHDTSNTSEDSEYFRINRDLTEDLFKLYLKSNARDFIYFSSVKAIADTIDGILYENDSANPLTSYGKSKLQAEEYILSQHVPPGKRVFIIRPCMIHGPGNKGNLNLLYNVVKKGVPWPLANFENSRSFLSIDNLSYVVDKLIDNNSIKSDVFNVADDIPLSTNRIVSLISRILGKKARLWHLPAKLVMRLAKMGDILPLPLDSERLKKLTESYVVSNSKIKAAIEVEQLPVSSEEGLARTIRSFRN